MSDSAVNLRRKIFTAGELKSVVRTMKAMAASNIGHYEGAVSALKDYFWTVQLGLTACVRQAQLLASSMGVEQKESGTIGAVVFGSEQGLVGQFNEVVADFVANSLKKFSDKKIVWAVGERIELALADVGLKSSRQYNLPNSISVITQLVGQILVDLEESRERGEIVKVYLFYNQPVLGEIYVPTSQRLLPLDEVWLRSFTFNQWPTQNLPEVLNGMEQTVPAFLREYLFVSLFKACAESLASENASRLAAMQRAEKNIDELLIELNRTFYRLRQSVIDEELFDVIAGFGLMSAFKK